MTVAVALLALGVLIAAAGPRALARARWLDREPVVALWVWQCVVGAVLLCCALSMALSAAAAWHAVRGPLFSPAPAAVAAYGLGAGDAWAAATAGVLAVGGVWTAAMLAREVLGARARRRHLRAGLTHRAPLLPGEAEAGGAPLTVLEDPRPHAAWLPGGRPRLLVTTAALRRLGGDRLDAVLAHERGHARARHDWLLHCSAALANGFPGVRVFATFRDEVHRLVELAADDSASRRHGRLAIALALVELNEHRGVFGPCPAPLSPARQRVDRLLAAAPRLTPWQRLRLTVTGALVPAVPLLVTFLPGIGALHG
ncbi:M56 family metallopeptidase [Streptomyces sp. DH12]|uniref:M56 family metallopeptidase n=1 Tax=Streptomyces sp. DH12 TaxID=2857010 RepID=UPI001E347C30|nr:M56 family metallopeptidase [Streptomyces sp. DH12]